MENNQQTPTTPLARYPGQRPFTDTPGDQALFFGRDAEVDGLFNRTRSSRLLVLFGKSGLGKTSLLRAGVFPQLRKHAMFPIEVRIGQRPPENSLFQIVTDAATDASRLTAVKFVPGEGETLWEFFKTAMFWRGEELLTPVLILDQFEEMFTLVAPQRRHLLAREIGDLASGIIPDSVREKRRTASIQTELSEDPPDVRLVISLREEYFGALQELSGEIQGIFQDRFRLAPMEEKSARDAIQKPAQVERITQDDSETHIFAVAPFEYDSDLLAEMLDLLKGKSGTVEPFQLQMLCHHIEQLVITTLARKAGPVRVGCKDVGGRVGLEKVFHAFYEKQIKTLPWREQRRVRNLCDTGLLTSDGHRLLLEESQIESEYHVLRTTLDELVNGGLLRREPHLNSVFYEISHDNLAEPILRSRSTWRRLPRRYRLGAAGMILAFFTLIALIIVQQNYQKKTEQARDSAEQVISFLLGEDLGKEMKRVGDIEIVEEIGKEVDHYHQQLPNESDSPTFQKNKGLASRFEGDIDWRLGSLIQAKTKYVSAETALRNLAGTDSNFVDDVRREWAATLSRLASVSVAEGNLPEALKNIKMSTKIREDLYQRHPQDRKLAGDLAEGLTQEAEILLDSGNLNAARERIEKASKLLSGRNQAMGISERRWQLLQVDSSVAYAKILGAQGNPADNNLKKQQLLRALDIIQPLVVDDPLDSEAAYRMAVTFSIIINLSFDTSPPKSTTDLIHRITQITKVADGLEKQLANLANAEKRDTLRQRDWAVSQTMLATALHLAQLILQKQPEYQDLVKKLISREHKLYEAALTNMQRLVDLDPANASWKMDLADAQLGLASRLVVSDASRAKQLFGQGLETESALVAKDPSNVTWQYNLVSWYEQTPHLMGPEQRISNLQKALSMLKSLEAKGLLQKKYVGDIVWIEKTITREKPDALP